MSYRESMFSVFLLSMIVFFVFLFLLAIVKNIFCRIIESEYKVDIFKEFKQILLRLFGKYYRY